MQQQQPIKDDILRSYIQQIFTRYDPALTGRLNPNQMTAFFNDLFRSLGVPMMLGPQQAVQAIRMVYPNYRGTVTRQELFYTFKTLLAVTMNNNMAGMGWNGMGYMPMGNMGNGYGWQGYQGMYQGQNQGDFRK